MMIKALIITHLWSLIIAAIAWSLQRDKNNAIGINFPPPKIWLGLVALSFLPGALSFISFDTAIVSEMKIMKIIYNPIATTATGGVPSVSYLMIYCVLSLVLMSQTLWHWARLQCLPLRSTSDHNVFLTDANVPPLTLSWPRRAIVLPSDSQNHHALIKHERTHLHYKDAEVTLLLLIIRDMMLRAVGIGYLVRQWRLAIELRADHAATKMMTPRERKDYAALLLSGLRSSGHHADGGALPCPTAHLTSTRHRSVKMRLNEIMENKSTPRKHRWNAALLLTALGATTLGLMSTTASAKDESFTIQADEIIYVKRTPPKMPASCPGLDVDEIKVGGREMTINGVSKYQHFATVGSVVLKFDVRPDGSTHNLRIVKSNHPCFEPEAKASVSEWMTEPQGKHVKNVDVMLKFMLTGETHEDINGPLNEFLQ